MAKADPFTIDYLKDIEADIFHLGSLLADDFSLEVVKYLSGKGRISIDSQGYLREVRNRDVYAVDWAQKRDFLQYVYFLKANEQETLALTGTNDVEKAAKELHDWGVKEVLKLSRHQIHGDAGIRVNLVALLHAVPDPLRSGEELKHQQQ